LSLIAGIVDEVNFYQ